MDKKFPCLVLLAAALASCQQSPPEAASTSPQPSAMPAPHGFKAEDIGVSLVALNPGALNPNGIYTIPVRVKNSGKVVLSGADNPPVNIGVKIDALDGKGAVQDFGRTPLPEIKPGEAKDVAVVVPVDARLEGHTLTIELVQEHVAWFGRLGQPGIHIGPYTICGKSLCSGNQ